MELSSQQNSRSLHRPERNLPNWVVLKDGFAVLQEDASGKTNSFDEPPMEAESLVLGQTDEGPKPGVLVLLQQRPLFRLQGHPTLVSFRESCKIKLKLDQHGSLRLAMLFQKVGIGKPRGIIVRGVDDGLEEDICGRHWPPRSS
jgi:hypothetical protein